MEVLPKLAYFTSKTSKMLRYSVMEPKVKRSVLGKERAQKQYTRGYHAYSTANKGQSTENYHQSSVFGCQYLSCNNHCDR